jgi:hypothetical protein
MIENFGNSIIKLNKCFMLFSCLAYPYTLKKEAIFFSENSVDFSTDYMALYPRR